MVTNELNHLMSIEKVVYRKGVSMVWKSMCGFFVRLVDGVYVGGNTLFHIQSHMCTVGQISVRSLPFHFFQIQVVTLHIREGWRHLTVLEMNFCICIKTRLQQSHIMDAKCLHTIYDSVQRTDGV